MKFKNSDFVEVKSGGPKMMVLEYQGDKVLCSWMYEGEPRKALFREDELQEWTEPSGGEIFYAS